MLLQLPKHPLRQHVLITETVTSDPAPSNAECTSHPSIKTCLKLLHAYNTKLLLSMSACYSFCTVNQSPQKQPKPCMPPYDQVPRTLGNASISGSVGSVLPTWGC
jgi:hypothetical protein